MFALLPCKPLQEPGPFIASRHRLPGLVDYRISQVSGDSIPYLCPALRPRLVCLVSPWRPDSASVPAAYASSSALPHSHAKLASRLLVRLCREGVEPSGIQRMVSVHTSALPPFPDLSWRYTTPLRNPLCVNNFSCDCPEAVPDGRVLLGIQVSLR
jgi:hypothetical protein